MSRRATYLAVAFAVLLLSAGAWATREEVIRCGEQYVCLVRNRWTGSFSHRLTDLGKKEVARRTALRNGPSATPPPRDTVVQTTTVDTINALTDLGS
jgi:hypothetical protein